jgi:hypothetical protein
VRSIAGYPKEDLESDKPGLSLYFQVAIIMKILYDTVSGEYIYPFSKKDLGKIKSVVSSDILLKIRSIRFGCNIKTTQEGRTVQHGKVFDIRINFCLNKMRSLILSSDQSYIKQIHAFGGVVDSSTGTITWKLPDAKRYTLYLLLHEIGHIVFSEKYTENTLKGRSSLSEEQWCDNYAVTRINGLIEFTERGNSGDIILKSKGVTH